MGPGRVGCMDGLDVHRGLMSVDVWHVDREYSMYLWEMWKSIGAYNPVPCVAHVTKLNTVNVYTCGCIYIPIHRATTIKVQHA